VQIEKKDSVALLRMNAGKANALQREWLVRMAQLLDEVQGGSARALVITGYESFFSAGLDLPALVNLGREEIEAFIDAFDDFMLRLFRFPKPVVAAINGHAFAGGCVLANQADVRIMTDRECRMGLNEVALGIGLPSAVLETLRAQVPAASLVPIALEGRLLLPREALALGLVHEVVPAAELETRAVARAAELGALAPQAFAQIKDLIRRPIAEKLQATRGSDTARWVDTWFSDEGQKRVRAAVEKLSKKKT
jgi:enoyl-CoA hydratase